MATLKTDYVNDILDTDVNTNRKYQMIDNGDGTVSFVDVTTYLQQGDGYGADEINAQNTEINAINTALSGKADSADLNDIIKVETVSVTTDASGWATLGGVTGTHLIVAAYYGGAVITWCELGSVTVDNVKYIGVKVTDGTNPIQGTLSLTVISVKKPS